jgi:ankyrin repeat protein
VFWNDDYGKANKDVVDYFLDAGADINKNVKGGGTILSLAALRGDEAMLKHLLARGADPNAATDGSTMDNAASSENIKVVEILLQAGAKVNNDSKTSSALGSAAIRGQVEIMRLLLANGADPNYRDYENHTALMSAVMSQNVEAVRLLLEAGADMNVKSQDERTALDRAEINDFPQIAALLINAGAKRGSEITESGNKDNPTTSWELYGLGKSLEGMCLGATLEPWPPAEGKAKLKVDVSQDDYGRSFSGDLEYRVVHSEKSSEPWIRVFGEIDEDGEFLSSEEIVLARGENLVQFRIKGKRAKDFSDLESWPLEVQ